MRRTPGGSSATFTLSIESVSVPPNSYEHPLHTKPVYHKFELDGVIAYKSAAGNLAVKPAKGMKLNRAAKDTLIQLLVTLPEVRRFLQVNPFFTPCIWKETHTGTSKKMWRVE